MCHAERILGMHIIRGANREKLMGTFVFLLGLALLCYIWFPWQEPWKQVILVKKLIKMYKMIWQGSIITHGDVVQKKFERH